MKYALLKSNKLYTTLLGVVIGIACVLKDELICYLKIWMNGC